MHRSGGAAAAQSKGAAWRRSPQCLACRPTRPLLQRGAGASGRAWARMGARALSVCRWLRLALSCSECAGLRLCLSVSVLECA